MAKKKTTKSEAKTVKSEEKAVKTEKAKEGKVYRNIDEKVRDKIMNEERESVYIEREPNEPKGMAEPVIINGIRFNVPRGVYVEVPKTIARIVKDSQQQTAQAYIDAEEKLKNSEKMEFDNS